MSHYLNARSQRIHDMLAKGLLDNQLLVKGGFALFRAQIIPVDAGQVQVDECRIAFYAGAQHVLACIMAGLDEGIEPTEDDLKRMEYLEAELDAWAVEMLARIAPAPQGSA